MSEATTNPPHAAPAPYRVLARKYRPQNFDDLIGQQPMVTTLTNAFRSGRIAQAYMLTGVRGVGKTTTARILARALNYKRDGVDAPTIDVREEGEHCRAIMEGRHIDIIEMDAASHTGIDDIRDIIEASQYAPAIARYKVYIIDEVHMLSRSAFNGLLKTLEEPPAHLKFIFATTEIRKVPVTVLSRCQRFDLRRIDAETLGGHLGRIAAAEEITIDAESLAMIARAAEGSVRDALSILDQAIAHTSGHVEAAGLRDMLGLADRSRVIDLFEAVMKGDIAAALAEIKDQYNNGAEPAVVMSDLADFIHNVTRLKYVPDAADTGAVPEAERRRGAEFAQKLSVRALGRAWQILIKGLAEIRDSERPLAAADMVLVRLTHAANLPAPEDLIRQLQESGASPAPAPAPAGGTGAATAGNGGPSASAQHRDGPAPSPGRIASLTGQEGSRMQAAPSPAPAPRPDETAPALRLERFEDLIFLAEDKRDIKLRTQLRKNVRLVSFADGRMELNLAGNPPPDFVPDLGRKLLEWTGRRWTIAVSGEGGAPTLEEEEAAERGQRAEEAREDPAVAAVLKQFPGARIVDVRLRETEFVADGEVGAPHGEADADEESLDGFFEQG